MTITLPINPTQLHGRWLTIVRVTWLSLILLSLSLYAASLIPRFNELRVACDSGDCPPISLSTEQVATWQQAGFSLDSYAAFFVILEVSFALAFLVIGGIIFWRKAADWMALFTAFALIMFAITFPPPLVALPASQPSWWLPVTLTQSVGLGAFLIFFYLFPDGRFVPGWTRFILIFWLGFTLLWPVLPFTNPYTWPDFLAHLSFLALYTTGAYAQLYRYLYVSSPVQRQQTKWIAFGMAAPVVIGVISFIVLPWLSSPGLAEIFLDNIISRFIWAISLLLIPLSIMFSILRYRLWDIDLLINRTLVYGLLSVALAGIYGLSIVGLQGLVNPLAGQNSQWTVAVSTLVIAALTNPLRQRIQAGIDHRFYRHKYDGQQTLTAFAATARDEVDLDNLTAELLRVVQTTMQPAHLSCWLPGSTLKMLTAPDYYPPEPLGPELDIASADPLLAYLQNQAEVVEVDKLVLDSPALSALKAAQVKLMIPLVSRGELIGLLNLGPRLSEEDYSSEDYRLLDNLAAQATPAVRVAQLVRQRQAEIQSHERIEQELRVARRIQQTLLPKELPVLPGWEIATYYQPAREVGGDFYDFIPLKDGRLGLTVGDVTDKGVPAALMMATTRTLLRAVAQRLISPGQVLERVNEILQPDLPSGMFVTCLYAILDPASGHLRYANAGHMPPYQHLRGSVRELRATGMPLGLMPHMTYEEKETTLAPGDGVLFYSDGLVEAHNSVREMFGFPRLKEFMGEALTGPALLETLLAELADFTGPEWEQEDDVTLVTLERLALG